MATKIIYLTSVMDDIYDVYATPEELGPFTDAIQRFGFCFWGSCLSLFLTLIIYYFLNGVDSIYRWDRGAADQLPDYMKTHFLVVLDCVDEFEKELAEEGQSYRIYYLKEAVRCPAILFQCCMTYD